MHITVGLGDKTSQNSAQGNGVKRRDFLKMCTAVAIAMGFGPGYAGEVARALTSRRPSVVWLHTAECTGCTESLVRTVNPFIDQLIFNVISLDYQETLMAAAGEAAEEVLYKAVNDPAGFICVVEGAIPTANNGLYGQINNKTILSICQDIVPKASTVISYGTCSAFGGIQAAKPNPTGALGVNAALKDKGVNAINIPGCPPNPYNIVGTIVYLLKEKKAPPLDTQNRPLMFFDTSVHDQCPRLPHFEAGEFAPSFESEEARKGWCLYELGCKGPETMNNCPKIKFNQTNWPVEAGHPCIGCSEPDFWDKLTPFYQN